MRCGDALVEPIAAGDWVQVCRSLVPAELARAMQLEVVESHALGLTRKGLDCLPLVSRVHPADRYVILEAVCREIQAGPAFLRNPVYRCLVDADMETGDEVLAWLRALCNVSRHVTNWTYPLPAGEVLKDVEGSLPFDRLDAESQERAHGSLLQAWCQVPDFDKALAHLGGVSEQHPYAHSELVRCAIAVGRPLEGWRFVRRERTRRRRIGMYVNLLASIRGYPAAQEAAAKWVPRVKGFRWRIEANNPDNSLGLVCHGLLEQGRTDEVRPKLPFFFDPGTRRHYEILLRLRESSIGEFCQWVRGLTTAECDGACATANHTLIRAVGFSEALQVTECVRDPHRRRELLTNILLYATKKDMHDIIDQVLPLLLDSQGDEIETSIAVAEALIRKGQLSQAESVLALLTNVQWRPAHWGPILSSLIDRGDPCALANSLRQYVRGLEDLAALAVLLASRFPEVDWSPYEDPASLGVKVSPARSHVVLYGG